MRQVDYNNANRPIPEDEIRTSMEARMKSFAGFDYSFLPRKCFDDSPEQRHDLYERLWQEGDFKYWLAGYSDTLFSHEANRECYNFWRDKIRARIQGEQQYTSNALEARLTLGLGSRHQGRRYSCPN